MAWENQAPDPGGSATALDSGGGGARTTGTLAQASEITAKGITAPAMRCQTLWSQLKRLLYTTPT